MFFFCQISDGANGSQRMTNKEALLRAIKVASFIDEAGFKQNDDDVIAIISANTMNLLPIVLGAFFKAIPISLMFTYFDQTVFKHILMITTPKLIFVNRNNFEEIQEIVNELSYHPSVTIIDMDSVQLANIFQKPVANSFYPDALTRDSHQTVAIVTSSGSTGLPKPICLSHKCFHMKVTGHMNSDDVLLSFSHLFQISGLYQLITSLTTGATRIITEKLFTAKYFLDLIEKYTPTHIMFPVPHLLDVINDETFEDRDLSSVKSCIVSGEAVPQKAADMMETHLTNGTLLVGYGMTEGECAGTMNYERRNHPTSVGKPGPNSVFKIVDKDGESLAENQLGEVCFRRMDKVFGGYYRDPEATDRLCDREGFLHSKDLGYFDSEGYLYIAGRMLDVFTNRGRQYTPAEIERAVSEIPGVIKVCAFGVSDHRYTDLVPAALVVKSRDSNLNESNIKMHIEMNSDMNLDGGAIFVEEIPRTSTEKYSRRGALEKFNKLRSDFDSKA